MLVPAGYLTDNVRSKNWLSVLKSDGDTKMRTGFKITKLDEVGDEMIVGGEVYAPYVIDSHGDMMLPEDIKLLAHRFLMQNKNQFIDMMHNNKLIKASLVESFIARAGDPDYTEGAWVAYVKIFDKDIWAEIKQGKWNGYSLEAMVYKVKAEVEYDYLAVHIGITEENDGHDHVFYVEVDESGRVIGGHTSPGGEDDHVHTILAGTATEKGNSDHQHRYFLNEIDDEG